MSNEANALCVYDRIENPMEAIKEMGHFLAKSGMFGCEKIEQGEVLALACICERKNPIDLLRTYHIIDGKLAMRADAMLSKYKELGGKCVWKQADKEAAKAKFKYDGNDIEIGFTIDDAKAAGLFPAHPKSVWTKYTDAMLRARLISKAMRMIAGSGRRRLHPRGNQRHPRGW